MHTLEQSINPQTRFLRNEEHVKRFGGLFALIFTALLILLVLRPDTEMMGLSGFVSLIIALIIASMTCYSIVRFFLEPATSEMNQNTSLAACKLDPETEQPGGARDALERLNIQKQMLDQHCLVSETDAHGNFTYVNDAFCKLSGYSREELIGKSHSIINAETTTREFWEKMRDTVTTGGVWQKEVRNKRKDGTSFWLTQTVAALKDNNDAVVGYMTISADITELKSLQEEIILKSKLAQLGQLTSTIAHEIRNPMGAVRTGAYLVQKKIEKSGIDLDLSGQTARINNGVKRCDSIITQLLDYSRSRLIDGKEAVVDDWLKDVMKDLQGDIPEGVEVECQLDLNGCKAVIGKEQLRRVIVNHVSNAVEAMVGKGSDVPENPTPDPKVIISTQMNDSNIEIIVEDNGPGITPDDLQKIRDPLFSTKSFGVGLGIPAVEKILENHGGGLRIETDVGSGTRMISWFPAPPQNDEETGDE